MTVRPFRRALAAVLGAGLLAGCGAGGAAAAAPAGPPQPGGTLRFAVSSDQGCVDPQQVGSNDSIYSLRQLVDSLTDQDPETGELKPWLATSWTSNPDATSYTFTLKSGVTFSDGTPLDAAAVKANFDRIPQLGARGTLPKGYLAGYVGSTVLSPTEIKVDFDRPNVQFLQGTSTHSLGIISPASAALSDDERCAKVIGSGPFVLESYTKNSSIVLSRRTGYTSPSSLAEHTGDAYLDRLEFRIVPESGVRVGSLIAGEVDAIGNIGQQDEAPLAGAGIQLPARANPGLPFGITFNLSRPFGADPAIREALSWAIDRDEVVSAVYTSATKPATAPLASSTPGYADQSALLGHDQAKAAAVLDAAGWLPGPDGVRVKDGRPLRIELTWFNNAGSNKPTLELLQQQVRRVGIDLQLRERPISDASVIQQSGEFDALWGNLTRADPDILRSSYSSKGANTYRFPASPLDDLLAEQAAQSDEDQRSATVAKILTNLTENYLTIPVVELTTTLGVAANVHGLKYDASSRIQLYDTWKSQA
ncbi:ABC transporter substrate-binding protein [Pseudonocardia thermophila]|jgi:ABC-type dipeptide transport system, periplasmic component|uniref:ABC transporter substrate-binding protein n=1 Tax=Pseudonocardia thermophila TaxID=1848 RepID=UPI00248D409E|nr:ABC transporter substrate-binding protein [Pseudonocardia thermophila]